MFHLHRWTQWSPIYQKDCEGRYTFARYMYRYCRKCRKGQERLA